MSDRLPGVSLLADGCVRIRATADARVGLAVPLLVALGVLIGWGRADSPWPAVVVAIIVAGDLFSRRRGVTLTPAAAVVHGPYRSTLIPWTQVQAVIVEHDRGCSVLLHTADGARIRLAEPSAWRECERFHVTAALVGGWWREHRGP